MAEPLWLLSVLFGFALIIAAGLVYTAYRRDMAGIRTRLAADSSIAETSMGPIEYAEAGHGPPVLVIHGAAGGFDQRLLIAHENFRPGFRIIAP